MCWSVIFRYLNYTNSKYIIFWEFFLHIYKPEIPINLHEKKTFKCTLYYREIV